MKMAPGVSPFPQSLAMKETRGPEEKGICSLSEAENATRAVKSKAGGCTLFKSALKSCKQD